jgi:hypothetical protein
MAVWIVWESDERAVAGIYDNPASALQCAKADPARTVERFPVQPTYKGERPKPDRAHSPAIP